MEQNDAAAPAELVTVAILDAARVYQGTERIPANLVTPQHVVLPNGCDLPPGSHRHDSDKNTFVPVDPETAEPLRQTPQAERAVVLAFIALADQGMALPAATMDWMDWYTSSMDFMGPLSDEEVAMIKRFRARERG